MHLKGRDAFIGWAELQRRVRLPFLANNSRLLILLVCHPPNLISRFMKRLFTRHSTNWQALVLAQSPTAWRLTK